MNSPDFKQHEIYSFTLTDHQGTILREGEMNEKAWNKTVENKQLWVWIRSNQRVIEEPVNGISIDTDSAEIRHRTIHLKPAKDTLQQDDFDASRVLDELEQVIRRRYEEMPPNSYTTHLFEKGEEKILKKLGEEAVEAAIAAVQGDKLELTKESADVIYHLLVVWQAVGITPGEVLAELERREGISGIAEKLSRPKA